MSVGERVRVETLEADRGVSIRSGYPRCLLDGAIMEDQVIRVQTGDGPFPAYQFNCPICGSEGYIE